MFPLQGSDLAAEVVALKNHIAELEDEKGNLQLKAVESEEALAHQGQYWNLTWNWWLVLCRNYICMLTKFDSIVIWLMSAPIKAVSNNCDWR